MDVFVDERNHSPIHRLFYFGDVCIFYIKHPHAPTCCSLGEVMDISHDSVNRFLLREDYTPP